VLWGEAVDGANVGSPDLVRPQPPAARDTVNDMVGRWCDGQSIVTFSRTDMTVTIPQMVNPALKTTPWPIRKIEANGKWFTVFWKTPGPTTTYELSGDKRTLVRLPYKFDAKRHVLHRC
jgi:hypothetical protein